MGEANKAATGQVCQCMCYMPGTTAGGQTVRILTLITGQPFLKPIWSVSLAASARQSQKSPEFVCGPYPASGCYLQVLRTSAP